MEPLQESVGNNTTPSVAVYFLVCAHVTSSMGKIVLITLKIFVLVSYYGIANHTKT